MLHSNGLSNRPAQQARVRRFAKMARRNREIPPTDRVLAEYFLL